MQCPILEPLSPSALNKRHPHELHWRREPPEWRGSVEKSFKHYYPHLVDDPCCLQCGAIPCPYDHEEDKKVRLQDLEFVRDLARERKELADKLVEIEKRMQEMLVKQNEWKMEKMLLRQQVQDYQKLQKEWHRQKVLLESEVTRLQKLNDKQQQHLVNARKDQQKIQTLNLRLEKAMKENEALQEENQKFRKMIVNQQTQIQTLTQQKTVLEQEVNESQGQVRTLTVQLDESREDLQAARDQLWSKEAEMAALEKKLQTLLDEMELQSREFATKEQQHEDLVEELRRRISGLTRDLQDSRTEKGELERRIAEYLAEIERLNNKIASDKRFRKFVAIKREVNDLRELNEELIVKVAEHETCNPMPVMKPGGNVTTTGSRVTSCEASQTAMRLNRPKSSRKLRPSTSEGRLEQENFKFLKPP